MNRLHLNLFLKFLILKEVIYRFQVIEEQRDASFHKDMKISTHHGRNISMQGPRRLITAVTREDYEDETVMLLVTDVIKLHRPYTYQ